MGVYFSNFFFFGFTHGSVMAITFASFPPTSFNFGSYCTHAILNFRLRGGGDLGRADGKLVCGWECMLVTMERMGRRSMEMREGESGSGSDSDSGSDNDGDNDSDSDSDR